MMIKTVIFDLDGPIVDSEPIYDELFRYDMRDRGVEFSGGEEVLGATWEGVYEFAKKKYQLELDPKVEAEKMADQIVDYVLNTGIPLHEGIREAIQQLAEHFTIAVVSSSARRVVECILRHHGLAQYVQVIVGREDVEYPKPHPQPYQLAMQQLKVKPEQSIVIEDSLHGATAGVAAGAFVYVLPDSRIPDEKFARLLETSGKIVHSFDEVLADML